MESYQSAAKSIPATFAINNMKTEESQTSLEKSLDGHLVKLDQWFSTGDNCVPLGDTGQCLEMFLVVITGGVGRVLLAYSGSGPEQLHTQIDLVPKV